MIENSRGGQQQYHSDEHGRLSETNPMSFNQFSNGFEGMNFEQVRGPYNKNGFSPTNRGDKNHNNHHSRNNS